MQARRRAMIQYYATDHGTDHDSTIVVWAGPMGPSRYGLSITYTISYKDQVIH